MTSTALSPLFRECHIEGPNGLWANYNNHPDYACSFDGYLMGLTPPHLSRLDDMSEREEKEFWDFTFSLAAEGTSNPDKRGVPHSRPLRDSFKPCHVVVALNDGPVTWQSIGSNHSHIVWVAEENPVFSMDIREAMGVERATMPVASTEIVLTPDTHAQRIRQARDNLRGAFSTATDSGFSLYTRRACAGDPRNGAAMVIEAWTAKHDSRISVSNALRAFGLVRPLSHSGEPRGLKYSCFEKT